MTMSIDLEWANIAQRLRSIAELVGTSSSNAVALEQASALCELNARRRADAPAPSASPRVCIESPLSGDTERNVLYADAAMLDSLIRDEAPFLGHLLYPRVLNDQTVDDRRRGIAAHLSWLRSAEFVAVYVDLGVSDGMKLAVELANDKDIPVVERTLGHGWLQWISRVQPTPRFFR